MTGGTGPSGTMATGFAASACWLRLFFANASQPPGHESIIVNSTNLA